MTRRTYMPDGTLAPLGGVRTWKACYHAKGITLAHGDSRDPVGSQGIYCLSCEDLIGFAPRTWIFTNQVTILPSNDQGAVA